MADNRHRIAPPLSYPTQPIAPTRHPVGPPVHTWEPTRLPPPSVPTHPVVGPPVHQDPPAAHHHHHDYVFVENYGWWPGWFPYWEPDWYAYWQYLYEYFGGDNYPEYAEYARDTVLRQLAPQYGWQ